MTESISRYVPGTWLALVAAGAWLLADAASDVRVEKCWLELRDSEPDSGAGADAVLEELQRRNAADSGGFAFVHRTDGATRVVVCGTAIAEITGADGRVRVVRQEDGSLTLPGDPIGVRLVSSIDGVREAAAALPIESGVVMASAVEYVDEAAMASRPVPDRVVEQDSGDAHDAYLDDFMEPGDDQTQIVEAADLDWMSSPSEPRAAVSAPEPMPPLPEQTLAASLPEPALAHPEPAPVSAPPLPPNPTPLPPQTPNQPPTMFGATDQPLVVAVRCPSGHLTPAESIYCRVCRAAVPSQEPVTVARPSLGRLRLSNGEVYLLDRDAVFGRKPEIPAGRPGPRPNAIVLTDDRDVSRNHIEIRLDEWRVLALDLGSMNGTQLTGPNLAPRLLVPGTAQEIMPGSVLTLAPDVWIYFEEEL